MGFVMLATMFFMQRAVGNPIMEYLGLSEPEKGPPEMFFLVSISIIGFLTGCLYAVAYVLTGQKLAIKSNMLRGFVFGLFIYFSSYFAQSFGLLGARGEEVVMTFHWDDAVFDFFAYAITFAICGLMFGQGNTQVKAVYIGKKSFYAVVCCAVVFPALMFLVTQGTALLIPSENMAVSLKVSEESVYSFYIIFYACFVLTGILLPILYMLTEYKSERYDKHTRFALIYSSLIWLPVVLAMFAFGMNLVSILIFSVESTVVFYVTFLVVGRILGYDNKMKMGNQHEFR